jgi:predicted transcriptional regulator
MYIAPEMMSSSHSQKEDLNNWDLTPIILLNASNLPLSPNSTLTLRFVNWIICCITHAHKFYAMTARTINVRLPEALYNQLEELAKATARTKSFLAIDALNHYVQSESWQIRDIHEGIKEADAGEFSSDKQVKAVFAKYGA